MNIIWHFGDGSDDTTELNPRHQFREPGNYSPTLTYCISGSCNKISKFNYIEVGPGNEVDFIAERQNGTAPVCTRFIVRGEAETFKWDFGDGTSSFEKSPVHCYPEPGLYTVSLTYTVDGAPYTIRKDRFLRYLPAWAPDFTYGPIVGIAPLCVGYDIVNPSQSWEFNFGDSSTSASAQATHCYGRSGNYFPSHTYCYNDLCDKVEGKNRSSFISLVSFLRRALSLMNTSSAPMHLRGLDTPGILMMVPGPKGLLPHTGLRLKAHSVSPWL